jgi:uncharacterized membrane protein YphA (DoxX/SURF4 family)
VSKAGQPGIYVEIAIRESLATVWRLTQEPDVHQRWDLRFSSIEYLPRPNPAEPQQFLYKTRIGLGMSIVGTGESIGERLRDGHEAVSSLKFASDDAKSLIHTGSGYWRYVPTLGYLRFLTWYDYDVRFGAFGRFVDRVAFRPLIGWAKAWSFDRLRLWAEKGQSPEVSLDFALVQAIARATIAFVWLWHGLIPKLLYPQADERIMLAQAGLPISLLSWIGAGEIVFGLFLLFSWSRRSTFLLNILLMVLATAAVVVRSPAYVIAAFNPITLNLCVIALSIIGYTASARMPSARRCLRKDPAREGSREPGGSH